MLWRPRRPFTVLFCCLLAATLVRPLVAYHDVGHVVFASVMLVFFLAAIRVLCHTAWQRWAACVLGLAWIAARIPELLQKASDGPLQVVGRLAEIAFLGLIVTLLIAAILRKHTVTLDNILGAFAGYLLIALIWGIAYSLVELAHAGSFHVHDALQAEFQSPAQRLAAQLFQLQHADDRRLRRHHAGASDRPHAGDDRGDDRADLSGRPRRSARRHPRLATLRPPPRGKVNPSNRGGGGGLH